MNENENVPKKSIFPKKIRILALILAVLLLGEIVFSNAVAVEFSSRKYADSEYKQAAEYIEQNDSYLTAGKLARMRAIVSMLGDPKTYEQFSLFASVAIADEDYAGAAEYLIRSVDVYKGDDAGLSSVYIKIGCLKALDESWDSASDYFRKAIELDEDNPDAWLMLCEAYLNAGEYEKALAALESCSSLRALSSEEFDALIQLKINLEKYDEALASCDEAEKGSLIPAADIALYRAQIYYTQGDFTQALAQAEKSRSLGGDAVKVGSLIAFCNEENGDYSSALASCLELIDKGLADPGIYQQAAQDAYELSDYETVIRVSEEALDKFGDNDDTLIFKKWLGISYFEENDLVNAEINLSAMIDSGESLPELNYLRGICEMGNGEYEKAVADFTAALPSDELTDEALYNRGLCYIKLGNTDAAANDFQEIIDRDSDPDIIALVCDLLELSPEQLEATRRTA